MCDQVEMGVKGGLLLLVLVFARAILSVDLFQSRR